MLLGGIWKLLIQTFFIIHEINNLKRKVIKMHFAQEKYGSLRYKTNTTLYVYRINRRINAFNEIIGTFHEVNVYKA